MSAVTIALACGTAWTLLITWCLTRCLPPGEPWQGHIMRVVWIMYAAWAVLVVSTLPAVYLRLAP